MTVKRVMLMVEWQVGQLVHGVVDYARTHNWHLILWHAGDVRKALREWRGDGVIAGVLYPDLFARKTVSGVDWKLVSLVPLKGPTLPYTLVAFVKNFHFMTMLNTSISMRKLQIQ